MVSKFLALQEQCSKELIKKNDKILYLGASHGITAEILSNIVKKKGFVYCLEKAPKVMNDLIQVCEKHENMAPLYFDASKPETYKKYIKEINIIYQDLAQPDQIDILLKNIKQFLKKGKFILMVKTRSIDVVKNKKEIIQEVKEKLKQYNLEIFDLSKTHKEHYAIVGTI